jgi:Spy/CpxP family protein refolding chaperone
MKNLKIVLMSLLVSLVSIVGMNAQPNKHKGGGEGHRPGPEQMMQHLDLTNDQQSQVKKLHLDSQKEILPIENQIGKKSAQLETLMSGGIANQSKIFNLIEEIGLLETSIKKEQAGTRLSVRELLTEDQQVKFDLMPHRQGRADRSPRGRHGQQ